jgi:hypothetical protein
MSRGLHIAMWSGPRNISTAMMRAWENRGDTAVVDEPFYAFYLAETGLDHPMRDEILATGTSDPLDVIASLTGDVPGDKAIYYQKHMTHHFPSGVDRDWLRRVSNCFLIRHPRDVLLSYTRKMPDASAEAIGFPQQLDIFEYVAETTGETPAVLDAADVLRNPRGLLGALCRKLGVPFTGRMLEWPAGPRDSDGPWAPHWYDAVYASTGFAPYRERSGTVPAEFTAVLDECLPIYERLAEHRLVAADSP